MNKVCIGIPAYGSQPPDWWVPFSKQVGMLHKYDIELVEVLHHGSMMVDKNRILISYEFLDTGADWLYWQDADNINPFPALRRLLDTAGDEKTVVSGLYFAKKNEPYPIAYTRNEDGRYEVIRDWDRGEIIGADAAGMNCLIVKREAILDVVKAYVPLQIAEGGIIAVHRDDIVGDLWPEMRGENDNKVIDGVFHQRVWPPEDDVRVPLFELKNQRTEDFDFFEKLARCGHKLWIDTSIECGHLTWKSVAGHDYRKFVRSIKDGIKGLMK